jgi:response regulator RpfG family c-di-GMP phosphodiesterase
METPQRILVLDDEGIVLVALREILLREGYHVLTCSNPLQALESLKKESFSVILTDQQMPVLTGLEFLAQAKLLQPDATRILITAVLNLDTVIDAINKGEIYRFIVKPWLREELISTVKSAVHRYELTCRNHILQASALTLHEQITQIGLKLEQEKQDTARQAEEIQRLHQELGNQVIQSAQLGHEILRAASPLLGTQALRARTLCRAMADYLHFPENQRLDVEAAALVSNLGFLALPQEVLRKNSESPGQLTQEELKLVEQHPGIGARMLEATPSLQQAAEAVHGHHERFDGWGYPKRLSADQLSMPTAVLAVAVSVAEAPNQGNTLFQFIQSGSGTAFHPDAVRAFLAVSTSVFGARKPMEVHISELQAGMILARGVYTHSGTLLIPEGQQLTDLHIGDLQKRHQEANLNPQLLVTG